MFLFRFLGALHFPHPKSKNIKRVTRLVVLPDYQGLGIGHKMLNAIAEVYIKNGFRYRITSLLKSLNVSLSRDDKWITDRKGRTASIRKKSNRSKMRNSVKSNSLSYSYEYVG